jgi:O-antigen/teichoic acid export membrane protein
VTEGSELSSAAEQVLERPDILDSSEAGRRFLRGGGMRLAAYGGGLIVGFSATPFVVRHLQSVGWGRYVTVTSLIYIAASLTEGGLGNLGVRELSTAGEHERREYMRSLIGLRIALTAVASAGAIAFALVAGYPQVLLAGTAVCCVGMLLTNLQVTLSLPLIARLRLGWMAANDFLAQATVAAVMFALVLLDAPLLPFFAVVGIGSAVALALTVYLVRGQVTLRPAFHPARWRALLSESIVYAAATALGVVYFRIVVVGVDLLANAAQTGYFALGFRTLDIVNAVPGLLVVSAFPILARAARDDAARLRYALQRLFDGGLIVGGWIALALFVGSPFIVEVLGGSEFGPSVPVLRILSAGVPATFLALTWSFALLSLRRYRQMIFANGLVVVLAVALCGILIPPFGAKGAAMVTATLEFALAIGYAIALMSGHPELRPALGQLPRVALALAGAFAVGIALPIHPVAALAAATLVFAALLAVLGAVPAELAQALQTQARRR